MPLQRKVIVKFFLLLCTIVVLPIILLVIYLEIKIARQPGGYLNRVVFNSMQWKASLKTDSPTRLTKVDYLQLWISGVSKDYPRLTMVDDLLSRKNLRNMTKSEVIELLGEPPPTDYFEEYDLVYRLGPERGFMSIDSEWLVIRFGKDNKVADYEVMRD